MHTHQSIRSITIKEKEAMNFRGSKGDVGVVGEGKELELEKIMLYLK